MKKILFKAYVLPVIIFVAVVIVIIILSYHEHSYGEWQIEKEPTCSSHGTRVRYCYCGESQSSSIERLEHVANDEWTVTADSTMQYLKCKNCDKILESKPVETHSHIFGEWITVTPATCSQEGLYVRECECGFSESIIIPKESHSFSDWDVIEEPKCGVTGLKKRTCECGESEVETIDALTHTEDGWVVNGTTKEYRCIYCDSIIRTEQIEESEGLEIVDGVVVGIGTCEDKNVVIPREYDGIPVTAIGKMAFYYSDIESIILPNSIVSIGKKAFEGCSKLEIVSLGNGVISIGENALFGCKLLKSIDIPNSTVEIGIGAFAYCEALEVIHIGSGVRFISSRAFNFCTSLKEIHFSGTEELWSSIEKGTRWDEGAGDYKLYFR